jgi:hypothetical protein
MVPMRLMRRDRGEAMERRARMARRSAKRMAKPRRMPRRKMKLRRGASEWARSR